MTYLNHLKYHIRAQNPDDYFDRVNVINFGITHNNCRRYRLEKSVKDHKTVFKTDFVEYPNKVKEKVVSAVFRNKRGHLWAQRDLMIVHFRKLPEFCCL